MRVGARWRERENNNNNKGKNKNKGENKAQKSSSSSDFPGTHQQVWVGIQERVAKAGGALPQAEPVAGAAQVEGAMDCPSGACACVCVWVGVRCNHNRCGMGRLADNAR